MKRYLLTLFVFVFCWSFVYAQESDTPSSFLMEKSKLLTQKGEKAELRWDLEEAVEAYLDAYQSCKENVIPLLKLSELYSRLGSYSQAGKVLKDIPLENLEAYDQSKVLTLIGEVAINENSLGQAADSLRKALKISANNPKAKSRLAMINLMSGMTRRSEELLAIEDNFNRYAYEDLGMCFAIDLYNANFERAYNTCELLSKNFIKNNKKASGLEKALKHPVFLFVSLLPLFLSRPLMFLYFAILFTGLGLSASALSKRTIIWHVLTFVFVGVALMFLAHRYCINDVYYALLSGYCYVYDGVWLLPKIIISMNLVALSLFIIFPMFKVLKENMRPATFELLGIWMFCFFFSMFVLSFQSRLASLPRFIYMAIGLFFSAFSALIMPLGRLLLYKISSITGIQFLGSVSESKVAEDSLSFTDAKLLQNKIWSFIDNGNLKEAISLARKYGTDDNVRSYPKLWAALIVAYICNEEYDLAEKNLFGYSQIFSGTEYFDVCQIYEAFLKSEKGDFPVAYKLVNAIPAESAKALDPNDSALSLLILGRCCLNLNDTVQAHINFNSAYNKAKSLLLKYMALVELIELDFYMNSKQEIQKLSLQLTNLQGEHKNKSYNLLVKSIIAFADGKAEEADALAKESVEIFKNSKALYWYGHMLCLNDKVSEAEALLPNMTIGCYSTEKLMTEVTSKGLV